MCSIESGLWCWDTTTQAASDKAPSQRRGWSGVLSFSFEVRVRQRRVTLRCKSSRGLRAANMSSPLRSVLPEYTMSIYTIYFPSRAPYNRGKIHRRLHVHRWKTFLMSLDLSLTRHVRIPSLKPFHLFLRVLHTFGWLPSILILRAALPLHKIPQLLHRLLLSSNLSPVGNDLALDYPFYFPF